MEILARRAKYIAKARELGVPVTVTPGSATESASATPTTPTTNPTPEPAQP